MITAFLSYSHKDREQAGRLKSNLAYYGIDAFLAHEDIRPSAKWRKEILRRLRHCEVFIPLISRNFASSKWTDQEAGFAMCRRILVVPVSIGVVPYGFLNAYQALKLDSTAMDKGIKGIVRAVCERERLRGRVLDGVIETFAGSEHFHEGESGAKTLEEFDGYSPAQVQSIFDAFVDNYENRNSFGAQRVITRFLRKYSSDVSKTTVRRVKEALP